MRVNELIERLSKLDGSTEVYLDVNTTDQLVSLIEVDDSAPYQCTLRNYAIKRSTTITLNDETYEVTFRNITGRASRRS